MSYKEEVGFSIRYNEGGKEWMIDRFNDNFEYEISNGILYVEDNDGDILVIYKDWLRIEIDYEEHKEEEEEEKEPDTMIMRMPIRAKLERSIKR